MNAVIEKKVIKPGKNAKVFHKIFLVNELKSKGFSDAIKFKTTEDIKFINSIKIANLSEIKKDLEKQLYSL